MRRADDLSGEQPHFSQALFILTGIQNTWLEDSTTASFRSLYRKRSGAHVSRDHENPFARAFPIQH